MGTYRNLYNHDLQHSSKVGVAEIGWFGGHAYHVHWIVMNPDARDPEEDDGGYGLDYTSVCGNCRVSSQRADWIGSQQIPDQACTTCVARVTYARMVAP